jgi:ABC-type branched-subunit amino acid transport system ATPase component
VTVLLIEHDMDIVFSFADRHLGAGQRRPVRRRAPGGGRARPRVKAAHLGESLDA